MSSALKLFKVDLLVLITLTFSCSEDHVVSPQTNEKVVVELLKASNALKAYKIKLDNQVSFMKARIEEEGAEVVAIRLNEALEKEDLESLAYWSGFSSGKAYIKYENDKSIIFGSFRKEIQNFDSFSKELQNSLLTKALNGGILSYNKIIRRGCEIERAVCERKVSSDFYDSQVKCNGIIYVYPSWPSCQASANYQLATSLLLCQKEYAFCSM